MDNLEKDMTIILPVMYDTEDRLLNFNICYKYIRSIFPNINIIISEFGKEQKFGGIYNDEKCRYIFLCDDSRFIKKCTIINNAAKMVSTPYFIVNDSDCVTHFLNYKATYDRLLLGYHLVVTHNNDTVEVTSEHKNKVERNEWDFLDDKKLEHSRSYKEVGGIVSFNTCNFFKAGMYSEKFEGWGCEDLEVIERFKKLGYTVCTKLDTPYHLVHLVHKFLVRGTGNPSYKPNFEEYKRIQNMNCIDLLNEVKKWEWCIV